MYLGTCTIHCCASSRRRFEEFHHHRRRHHPHPRRRPPSTISCHYHHYHTHGLQWQGAGRFHTSTCTHITCSLLEFAWFCQHLLEIGKSASLFWTYMYLFSLCQPASWSSRTLETTDKLFVTGVPCNTEASHHCKCYYHFLSVVFVSGPKTRLKSAKKRGSFLPLFPPSNSAVVCGLFQFSCLDS